MIAGGDFLLGLEIGGTKLQLGLGRGNGCIDALERRPVDPARGAQGILERISEAYGALRMRLGLAPDQVVAAGVGFGGPVDSGRGIVTRSYQIDGWENFPLADWIGHRLGIATVSVQNDADTAGLGEARFGAGVGFSPLLYVTIGSGIGGGLILDGRIYRGAGAGALEIGHLWVVDRTSSDKEILKLEDIASGWAIDAAARGFAERQIAEGRTDWLVLELAGGDLSRINAGLVAEAARRGDFEADFILTKAVHAMSHALNQAVTLLAPNRIILGGGVSLIGEDFWLGPIRQQLSLQVFPPFRNTFDLVAATLGEEVVIHGALALARDALIDRAGVGRA